MNRSKKYRIEVEELKNRILNIKSSIGEETCLIKFKINF